MVKYKRQTFCEVWADELPLMLVTLEALRLVLVTPGVFISVPKI